MVKRYLAGLVLVAAAFAEDNGDREQAIRKVLAEYGVARNEKRDPKAMASFFTEDADMRNSNGEFTKGRFAIEQAFRRVLYANAGKLTAETTVDSIRIIGKDAAVVDLTNEWKLANGKTSGWSITTLVMKKEGKQWRIESSRTSTAASAPLSLAESAAPAKTAQPEATRARTATK